MRTCNLDNTKSNYKIEDGRLIIKSAKFKSMDAPAAAEFTEGEHGSIAGYFSTFDRIADSAGDVVRKGAFLRTIRERKESGHPFPLLYGHDMNQIIGKVTEIYEDAKGAFFRAEFFDTARAQEIRKACLSGAVYQFSFAYSVKESGPIRLEDGKKANELRDVELYEISIVVVPANPRAVMTEVKGSKAERKRDALQRIDSIRAEEDFKKRAILQHIAEMKSEDPEHYRQMERKCLEDIRKAEAKGDTDTKKRRTAALKAIRSELRRLEARKH